MFELVGIHCMIRVLKREIVSLISARLSLFLYNSLSLTMDDCVSSKNTEYGFHVVLTTIYIFRWIDKMGFRYF